MTVHELVECLFASGDWGRTGDIPRLEAKIRKAVIEEASVGKLIFETREVPFVENPDFSHIETTMRRNWFENKLRPDIEAEDLLLIPVSKETP
jgi:hypothetical protein